MLIIGISGTELTAVERDWIRAAAVSGVILFTRNFQNRVQLQTLIGAIRALRSGPFLICVDQEGGPVQRFREGFASLPALACLGEEYGHDQQSALDLSEEHAWIMASEMRALDIDLSFAPVLDLKRGNRAIGERAFHADPSIVSDLGLAYIRGMRLAGMAVTIKHFPGHGSVLEDTHYQSAHDPRSAQTLENEDMLPFADAIDAGAEAVMMAHVVYPDVDAQPAGYSRIWIEEILRGKLNFSGVVFSDDIGMIAAESAGAIGARIKAHLDAGCDLVLVCSPPLVSDAIRAMTGLKPCSPERITALQGKAACSWDELQQNPQRGVFIAHMHKFSKTDP